MRRRDFVTLCGGLALCPRISAAPAAVDSLIHDLPRSEEALFDLTQGARILPSAQLELITQPLVEFAPRWPVRVVSNLPNTQWIALVVEQNPQPLAAVYRFKSGAVTETSGYLKIADSTQITLVVAAAGRFYGLRRFVTVVGHCV